jgi:hypothetical protein
MTEGAPDPPSPIAPVQRIRHLNRFRVEVLWKSVYKAVIFSIKTDKFTRIFYL